MRKRQSCESWVASGTPHSDRKPMSRVSIQDAIDAIEAAKAAVPVAVAERVEVERRARAVGKAAKPRIRCVSASAPRSGISVSGIDARLRV